MKPNALLLVSNHCPYCHTLESLLSQRKLNDAIGELNIINVEKSPEVAQQHNVRSVPWLQLDEFIFDETLSPGELDNWINLAKQKCGQSQYIQYLLEHGKLSQTIQWIEKGKTTLTPVVNILGNKNTSMNVRIGLGALLEHFEDTSAIREVIPDLLNLLDDSDSTNRIDLCHYLSLTHSINVLDALKKHLDDDNPEVREVAQESINYINLASK